MVSQFEVSIFGGEAHVRQPFLRNTVGKELGFRYFFEQTRLGSDFAYIVGDNDFLNGFAPYGMGRVRIDLAPAQGLADRSQYPAVEMDTKVSIPNVPIQLNIAGGEREVVATLQVPVLKRVASLPSAKSACNSGQAGWKP